MALVVELWKFSWTDKKSKIDSDSYSLIAKDSYIGKGSGLTFQCINGFLLVVYKYIHMSNSFY